jgi:hypothetical protein
MPYVAILTATVYCWQHKLREFVCEGKSAGALPAPGGWTAVVIPWIMQRSVQMESGLERLRQKTQTLPQINKELTAEDKQ